MAQKGWNKRPAVLSKPQPLNPQNVFRSASILLAAAVASFYIAPHIAAFITLFSPPFFQPFIALFGYLTSAAFATMAIQGFLYLPEASKNQEGFWSKAFTLKQRRLLGFSSHPPPPPPPPPPISIPPFSLNKPSSPSPFTPLGAPLRGTTPLVQPPSTNTAAGGGGGIGLATPPPSTGGGGVGRMGGGGGGGGTTGYGISPGSHQSAGSRRSPYEADISASPEHLQRVLDEFENEARMVVAASISPTGGGGGGGYSPYQTVDTHGGNNNFSSHSSTYRPSAQGKGAPAAMVRADGKLEPSTQDAKKALLSRLDLTQRTAMGGMENIREWMSSQLLNPLVDAIDCVHGDVMEAAGRLGWTALTLSPLDGGNGGNGNGGDEDGYYYDGDSNGNGAPSGGGNNTNNNINTNITTTAGAPLTDKNGSPLPNKADDEMQITGIKNIIIERLRSMGTLHPIPTDVSLCLDAINRYQSLASLLRGDFPPGLLPTTPHGYVAARIRQLAEGPCVKAFSWSKGGRWRGRQWSPDDLPTDSALLFYVFAAYLGAPRWVFPSSGLESTTNNSGGGLMMHQNHHGHSGGGASATPLYLGKLPPARKVVGEYTAVLSTRPDKSHRATALLGLQLGTQQPHFCLMIHGDVVLTQSGQNSLWEVIMLFFRYAEKEGKGVIAGRSLEYLGLPIPLISPVAPGVLAQVRDMLQIW